ncbi:MAG TPA: YbaK/EbsC family protein [Thermoanaerobaculia bacterium]|nr:YbaK/EbsC family protein [Thermoanaerobaculia bacterium]
MHPNAERVQEALTGLGSAARVVELVASTRTAAEAAAAIGTTLGQIAKSLVFLAGDELVMVIASGAHRVSIAKLGERLGRPVRRADPESVKRRTGFPIGGTPPIGHHVPLRTLIDRELEQFPEIWAAAGTPHAVFRTTAGELLRITGGELADVKDDAVS